MEIKELKKIKVLIADDIMILRQGLKAVLEQDDDIEVVALAENGKIAFEMSEKYIPDVVLMDMRMPEFDGEYGIRHIKDELPQIKVLVLTTFDDENDDALVVFGACSFGGSQPLFSPGFSTIGGNFVEIVFFHRVHLH